jgi:hypothetical protein
MKKCMVIGISLFFLISSHHINAQTYITIGEGDTTTYDVPVNGTAATGWSAALYLQEEINLAGPITHIAFYLEDAVINSPRLNQKIYMMHTSDTSFIDGTRPDTAGMTLVLDRGILWTGSGWYTLYLTTPFEYNNSDNLIIYWENLHGTFSFGNFPYFKSTITSNNSIKFAHSSMGSVLPGNGENGDNRPNTRLTIDNDALTISSAYLIQNEGFLLPGDFNKPIINIRINVDGTEGAVYIDSLEITTNGTTTLDDIDAIAVYYTGTSDVFSTDVQFGTGAQASSTLTIAGSQPLVTGVNNFWVSYYVASLASAGNHLDAGCIAIYAGGMMFVPEPTEPYGYREITLPLSNNVTVGAGGDYEDLSSIFDVINDIGLDNDLTVIISGSSTLSGTVFLDGWGSDNTFTMTVPSESNTCATLTVESGFEFNDIYNLVIDGGDQLSFINNDPNSPVFNINNVSTTTVEGIGIYGANQTSIHSSGDIPGLIFVGGNINNLIISGCAIGGIPDAGNLAVGIVLGTQSQNFDNLQNSNILNDITADNLGIPAVGIVLGTQSQNFDNLRNSIIMNDITADNLAIFISPSAITATVQSNYIHAPEIVPYGWTGIYDYGLSTLIDANTIILPRNLQNESSAIGIRQYKTTNSKIYNNFIYANMNNTETPFSLSGIFNYIENISDMIEYKFNTIFFTGTASGATVYGISTDNLGHIDFSGNIISNYISGTNEIGALSINDTSISLNMDYNNYDLISGASIGTIKYLTYTVSFSDLTQWQNYSGQDANSTVGPVPYTEQGSPALTIPPDAVLSEFAHLQVSRDSDVMSDITGEERDDPTFKGAFDPHVILNTIVSEDIKPNRYVLYQNFPNPFNPVTSIKYEIARRGVTELNIYNVIGQKVKTINLGYKDIGSYTYYLDMSEYASGLYMYQLKSGQISKVKKMLLLK